MKPIIFTSGKIDPKFYRWFLRNNPEFKRMIRIRNKMCKNIVNFRNDLIIKTLKED